MIKVIIILMVIFTLIGCGETMEKKIDLSKYSSATFAGGCFWCSESAFEKHDGVIEAVSGYANGSTPNPTYENYAQGKHIEAVQVFYDPKKISYEELLGIFWKSIDPTDDKGQFVDRGYHYTSAIFYTNEKEKATAEASKQKLKDSKKFERIVTPIVPLKTFYPAEDYHQDYYKKNPVRYNLYTGGSGRKEFAQEHWKDATQGENKMSKEELKKKLTPQQYKITQEDGTEPAFDNEYWDNHEEGIYVDIVSGEVLFSSIDKFDSGTGWPSFTKPLDPENIITKEDKKLFSIRTEVRSKTADSHLGHVFDDGPSSKEHSSGTGQRFCMNSAALRFIPKADLEKEGYGEYTELFE